jgi:hypothetical protein
VVAFGGLKKIQNGGRCDGNQGIKWIWLPNHGYQFATSKSTWKPNFTQIRGFVYFGGHFGFKMAAIATNDEYQFATS